jgi:hypothetical protein
MATQASSVFYVLDYLPVPLHKQQSILHPVRDGLLQCGFEESFIRLDHIFTARGAGLKVHQAAFTDARRWDPNSSGVNFYYNPKGLPDRHILEILALSGAPFNLIGRDDSVSLYLLSSATQIHLIAEDIAYMQVPQLLARYSADIAPRRIQRVKQGLDSFVSFPDFHPVQLRLFAVDVTGDILVDQFSTAVSELRSVMGGSASQQREMNVAVQLLAAVILAHKGVLGEQCSQPDAPLELVLREAHRKFERYFAPQDVLQYEGAARRAYNYLQQTCYSSFTPDILENLYIAAYPSRELRKWEGRYNTPMYLTQRVLENIPVETIPPAQRIIADMTCGVGNFLQSAYDRLSGLGDMHDSERPIREHIVGNDIDKPTADLAGMSLLLTSLTDRWHIDHEDALEWRWLSRHTPTVIVGNPPFGGSRKGGAGATELDSETGKRKRYQKADAFLERAIQRLAPGGYLAMVMPQSFVVAEASPSTRKLLLEQCDVLEIWELPSEVFREVTVRPMVLFAQRKSEDKAGRISSMPVRVRTVQRKTLESFRGEGAFTASSLVISQKSWGEDSRRGRRNTHLMRYEVILLSDQWMAIRQRTRQLHEVADITQGAIVGTQRPWADYRQSKQVKWLSGARKSVPRPYCIRYGSETMIYPNEFHWPRKNQRYPHLDKEYLLAGDKVLVVSDPDPTWGQRVKVAIERRGYYPSDSFWVLAPKPEQPEFITLEVLAAVVGWYVSNAWVIEHLNAPKISSYALRSIPFPRDLRAADCQKLKTAIRQLEVVAQCGEEAPGAQHTIDHVLKAAYQLDDATFERLRMVAEWNNIDPAVVKKPRTNPAELVSVTGGVEEVDALNRTITFWLSGFAELHKTLISDDMPGWMLRPGVAFRARISEEGYRQQSLDGVVWENIAPQEYTYLTEDELLDQLDVSLSETSSSIDIAGS